MCGINGIVNYSQKVTSKEINVMNKSIKHRGPDGTGKYIEHTKNYSIGIGHVRLSILDLSKKGHQPMGLYEKNNLIYRDKQLKNSDIAVTFNGEIYNFKEIRNELIKKNYKFETNSDTEVLLKAYEEWNQKMLDKLNGMFAFIIYDKKKEILFGARDRLGKKPLKYYFDKKKFIFSSELKAILKNDIQREIDLNAIHDFLTLQYVPAPKTGFKNIQKLPAGHFLKYNLKTKKLDVKRYWNLKFKKKIKPSVKSIEKSLIRSIKLRLRSDVDVGAFLSGGIDSSAIVHYASKLSKKKLKTFTIKFENKKFDESKIARKLAKKYNTQHHEFTVKPIDLLKHIDDIIVQYEEPFADPSQIPTYILAKETSKYVKVALNGDGGDENFGGYKKYQYHLFSHYSSKYTKKIFLALSYIAENLKKVLQSESMNKLIIFFQSVKKSPKNNYITFTNYFDSISKKKLMQTDKTVKLEQIKIDNKNSCLDKIFELDFKSYLPDNLMVKVDIASMAHGLEARSPFLDYKFVEENAQIKFNYKLNLKSKKVILKKMLKNKLPDWVLKKRKTGFAIPVDQWIRNELRNEFKQTLLTRNDLTKKLFNQKYIKKILNEHLAGINHGKKLWSLYTLNKWYQKYFNV